MKKTEFIELSNKVLEDLAHHVLSLETITQYCNPFEGCWCELNSPITKEEILDCISKGEAKLTNTPIWTEIAFGSVKMTEAESRKNHIQKIAYFATNDIEKPINIDVGIPSMNCYVEYMVDDGNHRLAGAIIKGDKTIKAHVSGSTSHAEQLGLYNPNKYEKYILKKSQDEWKKKQKKQSTLKLKF